MKYIEIYMFSVINLIEIILFIIYNTKRIFSGF